MNYSSMMAIYTWTTLQKIHCTCVVKEKWTWTTLLIQRCGDLLGFKVSLNWYEGLTLTHTCTLSHVKTWVLTQDRSSTTRKARGAEITGGPALKSCRLLGVRFLRSNGITSKGKVICSHTWRYQCHLHHTTLSRTWPVTLDGVARAKAIWNHAAKS